MNDRAPYTLLLVDDHPMMRRGIRQLIELESDMVVVGEAGNGIEAHALVERLEPDLILLDLRMPGLNGWGFRAQQPRQGIAEIPVLILTACGQPQSAAAELQAPRVASARGVSVERVRELIRAHTEPPTLGFLGRARVNVLELNLALDAAQGAKPVAAK